MEILRNLIRRIDSNDSASTEQLLPDFYAEHVTLAMNRERRKQALVRVLHLIRQDIERERRGREGLETLHRAFIKTPAFAADESTQNVTDKLLHVSCAYLSSVFCSVLTLTQSFYLRISLICIELIFSTLLHLKRETC